MKRSFLTNYGGIQWVLLFTSILLMIQFFYGRSLDLDESWIGLNLLHRSYGGLLKPLDYNQVAPIGFLWFLKTAGVMSGYKAWALRLYPFLLFLPAVWMIYKVTEKLDNRKTALWTSLLFVLNYTVLFYATEAKQYMGDVFFFYLILWMTFEARKHTDKSFWMLYVTIGALSLWFSNVSLFALATAGIYWAYLWVRKQWPLEKILLAGSVWLLSFGVYYWFFIRHHPTRDYMIGFWAVYHSFFDPLHPVDFVKTFLYVASKNALEFNGLLKFLGLFIFAGIAGLILDRKWNILYWTVFPVVLHVIASSFKMYPFQVRMALYLFPVFIFWFVYAWYFAAQRLNKAVLFPLVMILMSVYLVFRWPGQFPYPGDHLEDMYSVLPKVKGEKFVHQNLYYPMMFYSETGVYPLKKELTYFHKHFPAEKVRPGDLIITFDNGKSEYLLLKAQIRSGIHSRGLQISDSIVLPRGRIYFIR